MYTKSILGRGVMINGENSKSVNVIYDENGKSIVLINDIRFKTRRTIDWEKVEEYLREYIGNCYEILENIRKSIYRCGFSG